MARFVRIGNNVIHVPSLANVSIHTTCYGTPYLAFYFHNQTQQTVSYRWKSYTECEKDLLRVKAAMAEVEKALTGVPLTEPAEVKVELVTVGSTGTLVPQTLVAQTLVPEA